MKGLAVLALFYMDDSSNELLMSDIIWKYYKVTHRGIIEISA